MEEIKFLKDGSRLICIADGLSPDREKEIRGAFAGAVDVSAKGLVPLKTDHKAREAEARSYVQEAEKASKPCSCEIMDRDSRAIMSLKYQCAFRQEVKGLYGIFRKMDAEYKQYKDDPSSDRGLALRHAMSEEISRLMHDTSFPKIKSRKVVESMPALFAPVLRAAMEQDGTEDPSTLRPEAWDDIMIQTFRLFIGQNKNNLFYIENDLFDGR